MHIIMLFILCLNVNADWYCIMFDLSQEDKIYWKLQVNFIICAGFSFSSILSSELSGLDRDGMVLGLCSEPKREVDEDTLLGEVVSSFLETTSVSLLVIILWGK